MTHLAQSTRLFATLLLALAGSTAACGDDKTAADPSSIDKRMVKLGTCTPTDLTMLLPWTGPAFGPDGKLLQPLPAGHVEAVVNGWPKLDAESTKLREQQGNLVAQDVFTRPGLLGFQGFESLECEISASHTLWVDEASMMAFVTAPAHSFAMVNSARMHNAAAGAHWSAPARTVAPTWKEGINRLVQSYR